MPNPLAPSSERKAHKWWRWGGLIALVTLKFYYVQEMIAALVIFSVLFVGAATVVLIVFLLDRASQQIVVWVEAGVARLVHRVVDASKA